MDTGVKVLPLRPRHQHLLRHGRQPEAGERTRRAKVTTWDGFPEYDGTLEHQSTPTLVMQLLVEMKSQGVWSKERAWFELTDAANVGAAWLRRQDDPRATFDALWDRAYHNQPKLSVEQATELVVRLVEEQPGIQLVRLREAVGWDRGHLDDLLLTLVRAGTLRDERTYGQGGGCTSRRFWKRAVESAAVVAAVTATAVSLALLATAGTQSAKGHRITEGRSLSFQIMITSKSLRARGIRRWRRMAALRREVSRPRAPLPPEPVDIALELALHRLLDGFDV